MDNFLFLLITMYSVRITSASTIETTKVLLQDLFTNYSKDVLPVTNQSEPVTVNMDLAVVSINDFDEVSGTIKVVVILMISWNDDSLVWDSALYGNKTLLTVPQDKIWLPEMFLLNPADSAEPVGNTRFKITVSNTGYVAWQPGGLLKATCSPDVSRFPFDEHTCTLSLGLLGYSNQQMTLTIPSSTLHFMFYSMNSEWDVTGSSTTLFLGSFDHGKYSITIKRRYLNLLVSVVIPIIMLALVNPFVFILPFDSGERASYSITVLLAFTVYMTVVSDRMPASSHPMSYLSYYILFVLTISVLIVIVNVFQFRTYSKDDVNQPIPRRICRSISFFQLIFRSKKIEAKGQHLWEQDNGTGKTVKDESGENNLQLEEFGSLNKDGEPLHGNAVPKGENRATSDVHVLTWHVIAKTADMAYFAIFSTLTIAATVAFFIVITG